MSDHDAVTEQSPLLRRDHQERRVDTAATTNSKAQNGTATSGPAKQDTNGADVERNEQQGADDDAEALKRRETVKYILPVLAVGVCALDSKVSLPRRS